MSKYSYSKTRPIKMEHPVGGQTRLSAALLDNCHPEDGLLGRHCKLPQNILFYQQESTKWPGCALLCLDMPNTMNGSKWFDSAGQGRGKITLQKIIIQFLCKGNKSPLLPHISPAVSNRPLCQRSCFYDGSGAFIMTTQDINTAQHKTA